MSKRMSRGYVLHLRPYRNTSLIADIFTQDYGRVHLVAKGVKSTRSKYYGLLQQFLELDFHWQGNGELYTLTALENCNDDAVRLAKLTRNSDALASAWYCNELIMRFFGKEDSHPELYNFYKNTVQLLAEGSNIELTLRLFEKELVLQAGYALNFNYETNSGNKIEAEQEYIFNPESGVYLANEPAGQIGIKISGNTLLAIEKNRLDDEKILAETKRLMRYVISCHIGDKPLNTRKFVMQKTL